MSATIKEVAKLANVSVATVSRVVNKQGGVKLKTKEKIQKAIDELNYRPNLLARSVVSKKSHFISMIIPDIENPFFASVYKGVSKKTLSESFMTLLGESGDNIHTEERMIKNMLEHQIAGMILTPVSETPLWIENLNINIPICLVDRNLKGVNCDSVLINNQNGIYRACDYLFKQKHRKIGIINGPLNGTPGKERYQGYINFMNYSGLTKDVDFIKFGDFREESGYYLGMELLNSDNPPTSIISCNNLMTIGLLEAINVKGAVLGEDIGIIGFDDISTSTLMNPKISVISRPTSLMGELAAQLLTKRIKQPNLKTENIRLDPNLIIRGSESARVP